MGVTINKQKGTGDWYVWISQKGKRTARKIGKDKVTAMKAATMYRKKLALNEIDFANGRGVDSDKLTFGAFYEDYINNVAKHRLKYNSWKTYEKIAKLYLLPEWEKVPLKLITRQVVKGFLLKKQARGLVVNNLRICISAIFAEAVERELVLVNPAHNLGKVFKRSRPKKRAQFLSKEQTAKLLSLAKNDTPDYYDFLITAFRTGMRLGELLALAWDCINFDTRQIMVQRSFSHGHWDTPKSHKVRYIDMSDGLYAALKKRHEARNTNLHCKSYKKKKIYMVFPNRNDKKGGTGTYLIAGK